MSFHFLRKSLEFHILHFIFDDFVSQIAYYQLLFSKVESFPKMVVYPYLQEICSFLNKFWALHTLFGIVQKVSFSFDFNFHCLMIDKVHLESFFSFHSNLFYSILNFDQPHQYLLILKVLSII